MAKSNPTLRTLGFAFGCFMCWALTVMLYALHVISRQALGLAVIFFGAFIVAMIVAVVGFIWRYFWQSAGRNIEVGKRQI